MNEQEYKEARRRLNLEGRAIADQDKTALMDDLRRMGPDAAHALGAMLADASEKFAQEHGPGCRIDGEDAGTYLTVLLAEWALMELCMEVWPA